MFSQPDDVLFYIQNEDIRMVDLKTIDLPGRWRSVTVPAGYVTKDALAHGVGVDTSSYAGYKKVEAGDMRVVPDIGTGILDKYREARTLSFICDIVEPTTGTPYCRDPRGIARAAAEYFSTIVPSGQPVFSPELEFYIFSDVRYQSGLESAGYSVDSDEAPWNSAAEEMPNLGYKLPEHGGYHAVPPRDHLHDLRTRMMLEIEAAGIEGHYHHHEVGGPGQVEVEIGFGGLVEMADAVMVMKHIIRNEAYHAGMTSTFMPKPLFGEAGNGMHVHQYISDDGKSLFWDPDGEHFKLSELALNWIGGLLKHSAALLAFTSPSTNSYKRLVPGYEAPISAFFGLSNRTAAIRVPAYSINEREHRMEFRPPDATCNPYFCLAAMTMAGLDGVKNGVDLEANAFGPFSENVEQMAPELRARITQLPTSLPGALEALEADHEFLTAGGVFTTDVIEAWVALKRAEFDTVNARPHPHEYSLYYDL